MSFYHVLFYIAFHVFTGWREIVLKNYVSELTVEADIDYSEYLSRCLSFWWNGDGGEECWPWLVMDFALFWFIGCLGWWVDGLVAADVACKAVTFIHKSMCKQLSVEWAWARNFGWMLTLCCIIGPMGYGIHISHISLFSLSLNIIESWLSTVATCHFRRQE